MTWIYVLDEDALPEGSIVSISSLGTDIVLARNGGRLHAVSGNCPHMGCSLEDADRIGNFLLCPRHGIGFDMETGKCAETDYYQLAVFSVKSEGGKLFINLD